MKPRKKPIHPYFKKVGERIKYLRLQKGLSLETLGSTIGIDGSNMQKIEKGANITLSSLMKIYIVLKTHPEQFFSDLSWNLSEDDLDALTIPRPIKKRKVKRNHVKKVVR